MCVCCSFANRKLTLRTKTKKCEAKPTLVEVFCGRDRGLYLWRTREGEEKRDIGKRTGERRRGLKGMVYLEWEEFIEAATKLFNSSPNTTRYTIKVVKITMVMKRR